MEALNSGLLRKLADWSTDGFPVTSLYLDVDGRRHPRREDFLTRMEDLLKAVDDEALEKEHRRSVDADVARIRSFVRDEFERDGVRGLALFSSSGAGLWEDVSLPQPVRDGIEIGTRPRLLPLEALLERFETFCTVVADRERARILYAAAGRIEEVTQVVGDVPGWHDQGGWSQARFQRHIRDHAQRHLRRVSEMLLSLARRRPFDRLILAGADELVAELERELHDYVRRKVVERTTMPITVTAAEVLEHCLRVEVRLEADREAEAVDRLSHEVRAATGRVVSGLKDTLAALEAGRVEVLVVAYDLRQEGVRCDACGHLDTEGERCAVCGGRLAREDQLVEHAVESALRQRCRVETVAGAPRLHEIGGIGALLRF